MAPPLHIHPSALGNCCGDIRSMLAVKLRVSEFRLGNRHLRSYLGSPSTAPFRGEARRSYRCDGPFYPVNLAAPDL